MKTGEEMEKERNSVKQLTKLVGDRCAPVYTLRTHEVMLRKQERSGYNAG
jgi:hypothetical protein